MRSVRVPIEIFVWSRAAIWLAVLIGYPVLQARFVQPLHPPTASAIAPPEAGWGIDVWARWDGGWFDRIAAHGYSPRATTAFFPAYPLLVRGVGFVLGRHFVVAGVLVSLVACALAFVLLHELARDLLGADTARRTVLYLAVFPTAIFLGAVYSESLYLLLSVAAFLAATRGRWPLAGVAAGAAILTRIAGVLLLPALALLALRARDRRRAFGGIALALPIAAAWPAWLWAAFGHPLEFLSAERETWYRHLSAAGPLGGLWDGLAEGWRGLLQLVAGGNRFPGLDDPVQAAGMQLEALVALVFVLVLGVVAWRRLGAAYGVFVLGSVALPLSSPATNFPLLSMPRFVLGVFPVFVALAAVASRPRVVSVLVAVFSILLGLDVARWLMWQFIA